MLATVFLLMSGYMCFSYIMGQLEKFMIEYKSLNINFDNSEEVQRFINLLTNFNGGLPINLEFQT